MVFQEYNLVERLNVIWKCPNRSSWLYVCWSALAQKVQPRRHQHGFELRHAVWPNRTPKKPRQDSLSWWQRQRVVYGEPLLQNPRVLLSRRANVLFLTQKTAVRNYELLERFLKKKNISQPLVNIHDVKLASRYLPNAWLALVMGLGLRRLFFFCFFFCFFSSWKHHRWASKKIMEVKSWLV